MVHDGKGQPITDLTQADFEVLEDGRPQSIEQFRLIRVDGNPRPGDPPPRELRNRIDEELEISRDDVRLFVFFLDDYHVRLGNSLAIKEPRERIAFLIKGLNWALREFEQALPRIGREDVRSLFEGIHTSARTFIWTNARPGNSAGVSVSDMRS